MDDKSVCSIPEILLSSSGRKMPLLGMGTATSPLVGSEATKTAILQAIELGYRHFDTATLYLTEEPLGEAIAEALSRRIINSRDELFVTSKLWCSDAHGELVLPALQKTLRNLQLEYLDLYLIHWPVSSRPGTYEFPIKKEDFVAMDFGSVWAAMEECQKLGLTKSIGVSNFSCKKLSDILAIATIPPSVNQVEINPLWQQKKLREFCKANGIVVAAYAPLGARGTIWGSNRVIENEVLQEIANAKGKTVAQVLLKLHLCGKTCSGTNAPHALLVDPFLLVCCHPPNANTGIKLILKYNWQKISLAVCYPISRPLTSKAKNLVHQRDHPRRSSHGHMIFLRSCYELLNQKYQSFKILHNQAGEDQKKLFHSQKMYRKQNQYNINSLGLVRVTNQLSFPIVPSHRETLF